MSTQSSTSSPCGSQSRIFGMVTGRVRRLPGFQKHHHVPDAANDAAQGFVRKIGHELVKTSAEERYSDIRSLFGYKRREFEYSCEDGFAWIKTPDFDLQIRVDQDDESPKDYLLTTEICALHNEAIANDERLHACFTHYCDRLVVEFAEPINVDDKIDAVEDIPELAGCMSYEPDGSAFELKLPTLDLHIHVSETALTFQLLTSRNLGKLLEHSQKAFDILSDCDFGVDRLGKVT